jgi:hypothetical protein
LLGDAKSSLGDAKSSLGDAKSSLGDAKSSLGDAKSLLGDVKQRPLSARARAAAQPPPVVRSTEDALLGGSLDQLGGLDSPSRAQRSDSDDEHVL